MEQTMTNFEDQAYNSMMIDYEAGVAWTDSVWENIDTKKITKLEESILVDYRMHEMSDQEPSEVARVVDRELSQFRKFFKDLKESRPQTTSKEAHDEFVYLEDGLELTDEEDKQVIQDSICNLNYEELAAA
jgi:predicted component of type VI protein secretion system